MRGDPVATDGTAVGWRARWVTRENERRRTAYEAAAEAWRRRDNELRQLCARAEEPEQPAETPVGLPVDLDDDEVVATVQAAAELLEVTARHAAGLPAPELTVVPVADPVRSPGLTKGIAVVDAGMAVVTDRRLILIGRQGVREWPYPQLTGVAHHPEEPFTLLHEHGAGRIRGVRVPPTAAAAFRLRLTVAYADAVGERSALLDRLDEAVVAHWRTQPAAPTPATPAEAPAAARLALPALVAAVAVLMALAGVVGTVRWSAADRPVVGMDVGGRPGAASTDPDEPSPSTAIGAPLSSTTPTAGPQPDATTAPATSGPGTAPGPGSGPVTSPGPTDGASPTRPSGRPSASSTSPSTGSPSPTSVDRCGAPANPYGYNYCGGSYIDDPAADVCDWFDCVDTFWNGKGYLVQCEDGLVSMTGVPGGPCADHGGTRRPGYV
ncbi:hypothetical protein [Micromonospora purpureochromogenes]|uniref:Uncharacterized protein n=1 Tax=Micromonospora purpureochromogenes TaxID=47872 RepID=A0ABX2RM30_9ACTN|nr:hypothetical protein [Micromonospora purpureochromogenes]NYF57160.1 hypothetical protein [Micromonospora purpureochromogenes]